MFSLFERRDPWGTVRRLKDDRGIAVRRYHNGESVKSIAVSLRRSPCWVYTWLARASRGECGWTAVRSHRPIHLALATARCALEPVVSRAGQASVDAH